MMPKPKNDPELEQFQADLLQSVREYKAGNFARSTVVTPTDALQARERMALSQSQFAKLARGRFWCAPCKSGISSAWACSLPTAARAGKRC
jgi:hypothetical protein